MKLYIILYKRKKIFRRDFVTQTIDKCESEELAENVYKLKRL